jgi:enoyl-CoA hydratase/carnithine racemase
MAEQEAASVLRHLDDGVLVLTLHRPDRHNAWTFDMESLYFSYLAEAAADPLVRVLVVTGSGRSFCPGLDVVRLKASALGEHTNHEARPRHTFATLVPKPLIAAINGACAGIGFIQACCCDLRFAARGAKFTTAFARRGLPAENALSWLLPRIVGHGAALDLLLSGRTFDADEARALGLVNVVAEPEDLMATVMAYARDMAAHCSPLSMATIKQQVYHDHDVGFEAARRHSLEKVLELRDQPDFLEGVVSYLERRPPAFAGLSVPLEIPPP